MWPKPKSCFAVERNGQPIMEHPLAETVRTGVAYNASLPGLVPLMEERDAAVFSQHNWADWEGLSWQERANAIAHFRLHHVVELHRNDALATEMKRRADQPKTRA